MKIRMIALIALFVAGVASAYADASTGTSENKVRAAAGTAREIRYWKDDYRPMKELHDRYIDRTKKLEEQDEKLKHAKDVSSYSEKRIETRTDQINELTGKIDKMEREAGALDMVAHSKIEAYKLQKQDMEKEVDAINANMPYLKKSLEETTAHQKQAERDLREVQDRISKEYTHPKGLESNLDSREKVISDLEAKFKRETQDMTPEEKKMLHNKISDDFIAEGQKNAIPEPAEKPPHVAASTVNTGKPKPKAVEKPKGKAKPEEEAVTSGEEPSDEEIARAKEAVKTLKPVMPDTPPLIAGDQIIDMSCGTELMQSPDGKAIFTRLKSTGSASVTIVRDGKTYDITGREATKILVRNGYFVHMTNVGLVATNRYINTVSGKKSSDAGKSWRDDMQSYPMSPEDAAVYGGGMLGGDGSASDKTPAWRRRGRSYKMSAEDAAVYSGALFGGGAASREHDTPMSQNDANTYGAGIIGGDNN